MITTRIHEIMTKFFTQEQFLAKSKIVHGDLYSYEKSIYISAKSKIEIICSKHGSFFQSPNDHHRGRGCRKCRTDKTIKARKKTTEQFIAEDKALFGEDTYDYTRTKYLGIFQKVEIICKKHGPFWQVAHSRKKSYGCPKCGNNESKAEKRIREWLDDHSIVYQQEKTFVGLKVNNKYLRFDFYIPDLNLLIEFDGAQHFIPCTKWGGDGVLRMKNCQERDVIKNVWAEDKGYDLLRINYKDCSNIESILERTIGNGKTMPFSNVVNPDFGLLRIIQLLKDMNSVGMSRPSHSTQ